jgi:hypothetical protein
VRLYLVDIRIRNDHWTVLYQSLSRHPKLEYLRLWRTFPRGPHPHVNERKSRRTSILLKMLQVNTVLQELDAPRDERNPGYNEFDERILADVIRPYVRHLPHVRTFGLYRGPEYSQVLALALNKVEMTRLHG